VPHVGPRPRGRGGHRRACGPLDARIVGVPGDPRACGLWDTGSGVGPEPAHVIMHGVRDLDGGERVALDRSGVHRVEDPAQLEGLELFVHVDLDVLDPLAFLASFPAAGGLSPPALRAFLEQVTAVSGLVGAEITAAAPGHGEVAAAAIAPLLG
jgi:arginase